MKKVLVPENRTVGTGRDSTFASRPPAALFSGPHPLPQSLKGQGDFSADRGAVSKAWGRWGGLGTWGGADAVWRVAGQRETR